MALIKCGHDGARRKATVRAMRSVHQKDDSVTVVCSKASAPYPKGFPIWIKLDHDEALQLCAELATMAKRTANGGEPAT